MASSVLDSKPSVVDQVFAWRMESFLRLGYAADEAETLAYSEIELGRVRKLVEHGCPLMLAVKILS